MLRREVEEIKLTRESSHIPGDGGLLQEGWGGSRGLAVAGSQGPQHAGLTPCPGACEDTESPL